MIPVLSALSTLSSAWGVGPVDPRETYLLEMAVVSRARVPFAGEREVVTRSFSSIRFEPGPEGWVQHQRPCEIEVDGGRVRFPDAFVRSMPERSDVVGLDGGVYRYDPGPSWVGLAPESPLDGDGPWLDPDGDGHPGATVFLEVPVFGSVRLHIAQIGHSVLHGAVRDGTVAGSVEVVRLEQRTLGASVPGFAVSPRIDVVEGRSWFQLRPDRAQRCSGLWADPPAQVQGFVADPQG